MPKIESSSAHLKKEMRRYTRRGFLSLGLGAVGAYLGWGWIRASDPAGGAPSVLRKALEFNEAVAQGLYSPERLAPTFDRSEARIPRINGTAGLDDDFDPAQWKLQVVGVNQPTRYSQYVNDIDYGISETIDDDDAESDDDTSTDDDSDSDDDDTSSVEVPDTDGSAAPAIPGLLLTLEDLKNLPRYEMVTELKCIEGWSEKVFWAGIRLVDLITMFPPPTRDGSVPDVANRPEKLVRYVSLQTPDEGYYVGLDMSSALHSQTLLCYEMSGQPLTLEHGAPLRLVTPLKYGIKSIKRIGRITYTDDRPKDFWAERGYDWYSGH